MSVGLRDDYFLPDALHLAWKRVFTVSVDKYLLHELVFSCTMV